MIYTHPFCVNFHDTDLYGRMRPSAVLMYMQEVPNMQLNEYGPSMDELRAGGQAFLLSRIRVAIHRALPAYTPIEAQTWISDADRGYSFTRFHRIMAGGEAVAEAVSVWALVGIEDRRPVRVENFSYHFSGDAPLALELPRRIKLPDSPEEVAERLVTYHDVDYNGHINNTHYPDLLCDYLPAGVMEKKRVADISINFIGEAPLGETLQICRAADPEVSDRWLFRTRRLDGSVNIEAALQLTETDA